MHLGATSLAAVCLADGGDDDQHGAALTMLFALTASFTRAAVVVATPTSNLVGGFNVTDGGTWQATAVPPNITVSN